MVVTAHDPEAHNLRPHCLLASSVHLGITSLQMSLILSRASQAFRAVPAQETESSWAYLLCSVGADGKSSQQELGNWLEENNEWCVLVAFPGLDVSGTAFFQKC